MRAKLRATRPVYPMAAVIMALLTFTAGLFFIHHRVLILYILALLAIHIIFGYARTAVRIVPIAIAFALITGTISLLYAKPYQAYIFGIRLVLFGVSAVPTFGMDPMALVRSMHQLHLPRWLSLGVLITMRFISVMRTEILRIRQAMTLRGVPTEWYRPTVIARAFLLPLMMRILSISDLMSASLETRAFRMDGPVSAYRAPRFQRRDAVYLVLGIALVAATALSIGVAS